MNKVMANREKALKERGAATQGVYSVATTSVAAVSFRIAITAKVVVWECVLASSIHHKSGKILATPC